MRKAIRAVGCAALLASPAAMAGVSANVGVTSEYMFRGIPQTNGAAVQGGVDLATDVGIYVGGWASNVNFAGGENGNEFDVYGGWTRTIGAVGLDVGAIAYIYSEAEEAGGDNSANFDYQEVYAGGTFGPIAAKVYYSPDYNNASQPSTYGTATATFGVAEGISLFFQGGSLTWDSIDSYVDFSAGASFANKTGLTVTLGAYGTNGRGTATALGLDPDGLAGPADADADDVKAVISAKQVISF